jgi:6-pyruvoyltetrahydropterin/6-carboxytetrahydropterin synthase
VSYLITRDIEFDAGHRVPNHKSKCRNPHGHRYKVRAGVEADELITMQGASDEDMVADFGDLKTLMMQRIHDVLDHGFIAWRDDTLYGWLCNAAVTIDPDQGWRIIEFPYIPTAENIAKWCFEQLEDDIWAMGSVAGNSARLLWVQVFETPNASAIYDGVPDVDTADAPNQGQASFQFKVES